MERPRLLSSVMAVSSLTKRFSALLFGGGVLLTNGKGLRGLA